MERVWGWFIELNGARTSNGFGANPITYSEISAWRELTGAETTPGDIDAIKQLDRVYLTHQAKKLDKK